MDDFDHLFESVRGLAERVSDLHKQAAEQYAKGVDKIIRSRNRDVSHIEHTLDGLLDFCGYDPAFQLFRRLCRYGRLSGVAPRKDLENILNIV